MQKSYNLLKINSNYLISFKAIYMNKTVELVDLVDSSGQVKKRNVLRSEVSLYPDLYLQIVICIVFDRQGRVLVHKRAKTKKVNPGDIDHICGGVMSGETAIAAAEREAFEETGLKPKNLKVVTQGINKYNRYRYLLVGESNEDPDAKASAEVEWVRFIHPEELKAKHLSGEFTFVDEFFEDTALAIANDEK